ncbi:sensor histidine kinase [Haladaptatus sp. CMSO5]|uniref:sensor histidine kinase n=1 Tax=Haladaptatus sp. CMSO5 TaxID=3120514 RepID=UPI002FCE18E5
MEILLEEEEDNPHLQATARAHNRIEAIISDVLVLARLGEVVHDSSMISLDVAVRDSWQMVSHERAELVLDGALGNLLADFERLCALLENLFRNAIEHGGEETVVTVGLLDGGRGFYVADDGHGIAAEERAQIFEYGYTTATTGTGFGLPIVKLIAEAHGWQVRVTDSETGGARFEILTSPAIDGA